MRYVMNMVKDGVIKSATVESPVPMHIGERFVHELSSYRIKDIVHSANTLPVCILVPINPRMIGS